MADMTFASMDQDSSIASLAESARAVLAKLGPQRARPVRIVAVAEGAPVRVSIVAVPAGAAALVAGMNSFLSTSE